MINKPGYLLPEGMPETYRCYQVYVPDDEYAIAAFWGSLEYLGKWIAWERTDDHRGALMADLWKVANELSRDVAELGCDVMLLRQHPTEPCRLQYSTDGGVIWHDFANIALCPPWPDAPTDDGETLSTDILWALHVVMKAISDALDGGATATEAAQVGAEQSLLLLGVSNIVVWSQIAVAMAAHTPAQRATALGYGEWENLHEEGYCATEELDPTDDYEHWLDEWADSIFDWLNNATEWLWEALSDTWNYLTGTPSLANAGYGGGGGGANFGWVTPDCGWSHTFDFTVDDYDWYPSNWIPTTPGGDWGAWAPGVGWVWGDGFTGTGYKARGVVIARNFDESTITYVQFEYDIVPGPFTEPGSNASQVIRLWNDGGATAYKPWYEGGTQGEETGKTRTWYGSALADNISILDFCSKDTIPPYNNVDGSIILKRVTVHGTGDNPFD
jgi:hypothetical protein